MAHSPESILQKLVEVAKELCRADTAGISLLENVEGKQVFRWDVCPHRLRQGTDA
jgi:hypothetical protein